MKLKKIVSLALAGVLAVSMLAGCNGATTNPGNPGDTNTVTSGSAIMKALKTVQDGNEVVYTFEESTDLADAVKKQLEDSKVAVAENTVQTDAAKLVISGTPVAFTKNDLNGANLDFATKDSVTADTLVVKAYKGVTEEKACYDFANMFNGVTGTFDENFTAKSSTNATVTASTGKVAVVSFTDIDGKVTYYVAALLKTKAEKFV